VYLIKSPLTFLKMLLNSTHLKCGAGGHDRPYTSTGSSRLSHRCRGLGSNPSSQRLAPANFFQRLVQKKQPEVAALMEMIKGISLAICTLLVCTALRPKARCYISLYRLKWRYWHNQGTEGANHWFKWVTEPHTTVGVCTQSASDNRANKSAPSLLSFSDENKSLVFHTVEQLAEVNKEQTTTGKKGLSATWRLLWGTG
jgi:hypothetical protein